MAPYNISIALKEFTYNSIVDVDKAIYMTSLIFYKKLIYSRPLTLRIIPFSFFGLLYKMC